MTIEQAVLERVRTLTPDKQRKVLDFAESLSEAASPKPPRRKLKGMCADLIDKPLTREEIDDARQEMWGNFPREDIA